MSRSRRGRVISSCRERREGREGRKGEDRWSSLEVSERKRRDELTSVAYSSCFSFLVSLEREGVFEVQQEGSNFDEVEIEVVFLQGIASLGLREPRGDASLCFNLELSCKLLERRKIMIARILG